MDCSHYIGFVGFNRDVITQANQRLGSKMKNNLRLIFLKDSLYTLTIADIGTKVGLNFLADTGKYEIVSSRKRVLSHTNHLGPQFMQPDGKPATFKTRMTGDKDTFAPIKIIKYINSHTAYHTFQGATP